MFQVFGICCGTRQRSAGLRRRPTIAPEGRRLPHSCRSRVWLHRLRDTWGAQSASIQRHFRTETRGRGEWRRGRIYSVFQPFGSRADGSQSGRRQACFRLRLPPPPRGPCMPKYVVRTGVMRALGVYSSSRDENFRRDTEVVVRTRPWAGDRRGAVRRHRSGHQPDQRRRARPDPAHDVGRRRPRAIAAVGPGAAGVPNLRPADRAGEAGHATGRRRARVWRRADRDLLPGRESGRFSRAGAAAGRRSFRRGSKCGRSASATKPSCWPTTATAASRSAATRTCREMPPVSMKMAKMQKATLDPTKISGRCGRLKCCLRYEYDTYEALQKELPPLGSRRGDGARSGPRAGARDPGRTAAGRDRRPSPRADRRQRGVDRAQARRPGRESSEGQ